ncbi:hypothetical protein DN752_13145 [Echinicola strongylocentroti]|uniref:DUF4382 domain-containing protein n=1 Tax=Echinicola strongylocentroti TaxID=1795355 RepID=A0A2Z4IIM8_9BACT|nr:DUF4382 domain-containing protein [Echinicola strongylocentroti]AWW30992.1 hypothetical protein DN752_13145 [Echinicola strongylocentroti]
MDLSNTKNWAIAILVVVIFASCNSEDDEIREGNAKVNVSLIDAPADYDGVWVDVLGVEILPGDVDGNDESAWINIPYENEDGQVDLLTLTGGNAEFIGSKEVPAGKISQIRLLLGEDNYLVMDGERIELTTPSAQQSGLKLQLNQELMAGIQYDLVIDFDAAKSIVEAGNSGRYILKPVIRAVAEESASIEGQVLPVEADPVIYGVINEDTVSTFTNETGAFALRGLVSGDYTIIIDPVEGYQTAILHNVTAVEGEVTLLDPIELETSETMKIADTIPVL